MVAHLCILQVEVKLANLILLVPKSWMAELSVTWYLVDIRTGSVETTISNETKDRPQTNLSLNRLDLPIRTNQLALNPQSYHISTCPLHAQVIKCFAYTPYRRSNYSKVI